VTSTDTSPGFNHNNFYHPYLLRQVPSGCNKALDVGCGTGLFVRRLAAHSRSVEGIDRAPEVVSAARTLSESIPNVSYLEADLVNADLRSEHYDYISCIASIHHMPFAQAVKKLHDALAPGGVLAILGCYRQTTPIDYLPDLIAIPANKARTAVMSRKTRLRHSSALPEHHQPTAPVMEPNLTLPEIKDQAQTLLPGAIIRRRLYWRYTLTYQRPTTETP
jgi:SAM-dependent methyltransferase